MAFNPYTAVSNIVNFKDNWAKADAEETEDKDAKIKKLLGIEEAAKPYYQQLRDNGYGNIADQLSASNYGQAQQVAADFKNQGKSGLVAGRNYMTNQLTNKYGLTKQQADSLITYDPITGGDVRLGGMSIGNGDALIDDTNYYNQSYLDDKLSDYAKNMGLTVNPKVAAQQTYDNGMNFINDDRALRSDEYGNLRSLYDRYNNLTFTSPTDTDFWNDIVNSFVTQGDAAGYAAIATGAGANGGNIDTNAQADAERQMAAFRSAGIQAANSSYQGWLDSILGGIQARSDEYAKQHGYTMDDINAMPQLLSGIMDADQQAFEQKQTALNNQTDRWATQAEISGYNPTEMSYANNPYVDVDEYGHVTLNEQGLGLTKLEGGIQAAINAARERGDEAAVERLSVARDVWLNMNPDLNAQWGNSGDRKSPTASQTEAAREFDSDQKLQKELAEIAAKTAMEGELTERNANQLAYLAEKYGVDADVLMKRLELELDKYEIDTNAALTREQMAQTATTGSSGSKSGGSSGGSSNRNSGALGGDSPKEPTLSLDSINRAINIYNSGQGENYTDSSGKTLDNNGYRLLEGMKTYTEANGGMTAGEIRQYAVNNSASFNVDKRQFSFVLDVLNITGKDKENILEGIVNADPGDYSKGMKFSTNTDSSDDHGGMELPGGF